LQQAVELLEPWLSDHPDEASAWAALGAAHFELENWAGAEKAICEVVRLRPDNAREWCNLGTVLRKLGRLHEAKQAQGQALTLDSSYERAHTELRKLEGLQEGTPARPLDAEADHDPPLDQVRTDESSGGGRVSRRTGNLVWAMVCVALLLVLVVFVAVLAEHSERQIEAGRAARAQAEREEVARRLQEHRAEQRRQRQALEEQDRAYEEWLARRSVEIVQQARAAEQERRRKMWVRHKLPPAVVAEPHWLEERGTNVRYIVGDLRNRSDLPVNYSISFGVYDKRGRKIGSAWDRVSDWPPGEVWHYKALVFEDSAHSFRLEDEGFSLF
jgi:tetratricopeptide (TPR) repeat protein